MGPKVLNYASFKKIIKYYGSPAASVLFCFQILKGE